MKSPAEQQQQSNHLISPQQQLIQYLNSHNIEKQPNKNKIDNNMYGKILEMLKQRDQTIKALEEHITKYKSEQLKNSKLISQLQDKITQICPNNNNTGSRFMMAAQFKQFFDDFMKNTLSVCLSPLLCYPQAYSKYCSILFKSVYNSINSHINTKITKICQILELEQNQQSFHLIRGSLIKILQDNWQKILSYTQQNQSQQTSFFIQKVKNFLNPEILQIINSEEFKQLDKKLIKICGYMILQDKKWNFIMPEYQQNQQKDNKKIEKFIKKQYVCIDGWIKQKQDVIVILQGLCRESDQNGNIAKHQNLKNYVIPYSKDEQNEYKLIKKNLQKQTKQAKNVQHKVIKIDQSTQFSPCKIKQSSLSTPKSKSKSKLKSKQIANVRQQKQQNVENKQNIVPSNVTYNSVESSQMKINFSDTHLRNGMKKSINNLTITHQQNVEHKKNKADKIETAIRKLNKAEQKLAQQDLNLNVDSISVMFSGDRSFKEKDSKINNQIKNLGQAMYESNINPSLSMVKSSKLKISNNHKTNHNLVSDPSFQQFLSLPQRKKDIIDQLPFKRQSSRNKKSSSRKISAGKIVGQAIAQYKQNLFLKNNKEIQLKDKQRQNCIKQAAYKDIIKQKLGGQHKTQREKPKQSKHKTKEQDRPFKAHINKMRQKFLN